MKNLCIFACLLLVSATANAGIIAPWLGAPGAVIAGPSGVITTHGGLLGPVVAPVGVVAHASAVPSTVVATQGATIVGPSSASVSVGPVPLLHHGLYGYGYHGW